MSSQITLGDNFNLNANGSISANYSGVYGNQIASSHGIGVAGAAGLTGYYYNPNFLSFNVDPFYNQSRSNSNFGSVTNASGVSMGASIFSGSHFPGSVNYSTTFNNTGNYGLPGITSLDTNGNAQSFGVTWSALLPDFPTLTVGYQQGSSHYTLYGTDQNGNSHFRSLFLNSTYNIAGFSLSGGINHGTSGALIPGVIIGGQDATSNSDSTGYSMAVSHALPWNGNWSSYFNRTDLNSDYLGYAFNGSIDRFATNVGLNPTPKLHFAIGTDYTDNLSGSIYQSIVPTSGPPAGAAGAQDAGTTTSSGIVQTSSQSAQAWDFILSSSYAIATNLQVQGEFDRRQQSYLGTSYGSNLYSAGVYYTRALVGGYFGTSFSVTDSTLDGSSQSQLGFAVNTNYNRQFGHWLIGGYFNYAQNAQTLLVTYTSSFYNFSGNVSRRFGRWYWNANAGGGRSGLTAVPGSNSSSENFATSIGTGRVNVTATYAKSSGNSLAGGGGLIPTPLPPIIPPELLVLYGGRSYSVALSGSPVRHLLASASYVKSRSDLTNQGLFTWNNYESENMFLQYQFRQVGINGGYSRLVQGFSGAGAPPARVSSFSIGVYRWFNFF